MAREYSFTWKVLLCVCLTMSMASKNLSTKASQGSAARVPYLFFVVSFCVEGLKFTISAVQLLWERTQQQIASKSMDDEMELGDNGELLELTGWKENALYAGPAIMFTVTNNTQFLIIERLNPATVSVIWNLKIVCTALMLRFALHKMLSMQQWIAICMLTVGILVSQASHLSEHGESSSDAQQDYVVGVSICLFNITINVGANVMCEHLFKRTSASQFEQYIRLYAMGMAANVLCLLVNDTGTIASDGLFQGFNAWTVVCIFCLGLAGFFVGMTFKHLDNIAVVFADCSAMIVVSLVSWLFFGLQLSFSFVAGVTMCGAALWLYYKPGPGSNGHDYTLVAPEMEEFGLNEEGNKWEINVDDDDADGGLLESLDMS